MAITHTTTVAWAGSSGGSLSASVSKESNGEQNRVLSLAAATPDQQFDLDFEYAKLKSILMVATQDVTVETNSPTAVGGNTITLKANVPFFWVHDCGLANPFTANVTTIYVTVAGTATAQLDIRALIDSAA